MPPKKTSSSCWKMRKEDCLKNKDKCVWDKRCKPKAVAAGEAAKRETKFEDLPPDVLRLIRGNLANVNVARLRGVNKQAAEAIERVKADATPFRLAVLKEVAARLNQVLRTHKSMYGGTRHWEVRVVSGHPGHKNIQLRIGFDEDWQDGMINVVALSKVKASGERVNSHFMSHETWDDEGYEKVFRQLDDLITTNARVRNNVHHMLNVSKYKPACTIEIGDTNVLGADTRVRDLLPRGLLERLLKLFDVEELVAVSTVRKVRMT